jgi:acyl-CoA thioester hydrolase
MSRIPVRWRDLDPLGHVNSAVFLTFLETGRDLWLREVLGEEFGPEEYVVARIEVDFRTEVPQGTDYVQSVHEVEAVGRTSITLSERLLDPNGVTVTEARTVIVLFDSEAHGSRQVTEPEREALSGLAITP